MHYDGFWNQDCDTFPVPQHFINGYSSPYHHDRVSKRGGLICDALRDLVPFVQFKKREKHLWRSVNFSKVAGWSQIKPSSNFICDTLRETLDYLSRCFDNMTLMGDTNVEPNVANMQKKPNLLWRNKSN